MRKFKTIGFVGLLLMGMGTQSPAQQLQKGWQVGAALPAALDGLKDWTNEPILGLCLDGAYVMPMIGDKAFFRVGLGLNYFPGKAKEIKALYEGLNLNGYPIACEHVLATFEEGDSRTISLTGFQINADIIIPIGSTPLSLLTGISLNAWHKKVSGVYPHDWRSISGVSGWVYHADRPTDGRDRNGWIWEVTTPYYPIDSLGRDNSVSGFVDNIFGRYGLRLGAEYALSDKLAVAATLQMTELGTDYEFLEKKFRVSYDSNGQEVPGSEVKNNGKHRVNPAWIQVGVRYRF